MYRNTQTPVVNVHTLRNEFFSTRNPNKRQEVVRRVESFKNAPHYAFTAGEMCLELAHAKNQSPERSANWMDRAQTNWIRTITVSKEVTHHVGRASAQLALYDTHFSHAVERKIPSTEILQADYRKLLQVTQAQAAELHGATERSERLSNIAGALGEWSVDLLAMRFSINEGDGTWMAVPSLISQDMGVKKPGYAKNDSWDTSIFTQYDADLPPELTYKVQTKTRQQPDEDEYEDDITVIHVSSDLDVGRMGGRHGVPSTRIPHECYAEEHNPDTKFGRISMKALNLREGLLLELLG